MKNEIENFIIDWNKNTEKLKSNSFFGGKTASELVEYCLKIHKIVSIEKLLIKLQDANFKNLVLDLNQLVSALKTLYHINNYKERDDAVRKFKFEDEKRGLYDLTIKRNVILNSDNFIIPEINEEQIIEKIIDEYHKKENYNNYSYSFYFIKSKIIILRLLF